MCEDHKDCNKQLLVEHMHGSSEPSCKMKLMKMSKGWQWELSCSGDDFPSIMKKIDEANETMKQKYGVAADA